MRHRGGEAADAKGAGRGPRRGRGGVGAKPEAVAAHSRTRPTERAFGGQRWRRAAACLGRRRRRGAGGRVLAACPRVVVAWSICMIDL